MLKALRKLNSCGLANCLNSSDFLETVNMKNTPEIVKPNFISLYAFVLQTITSKSMEFQVAGITEVRDNNIKSFADEWFIDIYAFNIDFLRFLMTFA
ncbi:CLUMA_CG004641, isoform A [Clunio marinus]|uniref:CLUMA_CG004641, isoform A n=1 Tax=Clunio marinus TaxID=568069 RepID=A0A1J1HS89_9DIPT|nr:CLUMA_CG004641, isoform A [Clunio marinus]